MQSIHVNGKSHSVDVTPDTPLLWALREQLGLTGTKYGCGIEVCGACTVLVGDRPVSACTFLAVDAEADAVRTVIAAYRPGSSKAKRCLRPSLPS